MIFNIKNVAEFVAIVLEQSRGLNPVYRGLSDVSYPLIPSIGRHVLWRGGKAKTKAELARCEFEMIDEFRIRSIPFISGRDGNPLETMIRAQHHGVPTRLMDWTSNPLVALYFAAKSVAKKCDGVVYMTTLPKSFREIKGDVANPHTVIEDCHVVPQHIDSRITAQSSVFTLHPDPYTPVDTTAMFKIQFEGKHRDKIMGELDVLGIDAASMFPGLSGLGEHIKQRKVGFS